MHKRNHRAQYTKIDSAFPCISTCPHNFSVTIRVRLFNMLLQKLQISFEATSPQCEICMGKTHFPSKRNSWLFNMTASNWRKCKCSIYMIAFDRVYFWIFLDNLLAMASDFSWKCSIVSQEHRAYLIEPLSSNIQSWKTTRSKKSVFLGSNAPFCSKKGVTFFTEKAFFPPHEMHMSNPECEACAKESTRFQTNCAKW